MDNPIVLVIALAVVLVIVAVRCGHDDHTLYDD